MNMLLMIVNCPVQLYFIISTMCIFSKNCESALQYATPFILINNTKSSHLQTFNNLYWYHLLHLLL